MVDIHSTNTESLLCAGFSLFAWDIMVSKANRNNVKVTSLTLLTESHC